MEHRHIKYWWNETLNIRSYINRSSIIITNNTEVSANELDIDPINNRAFATINVNNAADVVLAKSVSNNNPLNREIISFNIIAANAGPNTAINTVVSDILPNINKGLANTGALEFISGISSNGSTNSYDNNNGICNIGDLSPNSVVVLTILAKVVKSCNITNFATISSNTFDPNTTNNNANVSISTQKSTDLVVTKTVNDTNPVISQNISYTITVVNNGPDNATGVYVNDIIP